MPKSTQYGHVCTACGHPAAHRLRLVLDATPMRVWYLCANHAEVVARGDYAVQLDPNWGGKWMPGPNVSSDERSDRG